MSDLAAIEAIDDVESPKRRPLSFVAAHRVVSEATKAALEAAPEDGYHVLTRHMSGVLAPDPCANDLDAWVRHGLMSGATSAWRGESRPVPRDLPSTFAHRVLYAGAHGIAAEWVQAVKMTEGVRHGG